MNSEQLFGMALGLHTPWQVDAIEFKPSTKGGEALHLTIGFPRGSRFPDSKGQACPVYDTVKRTWQHLNFFKHACCRASRPVAGGSKRWRYPGRGLVAASPCCSKLWRWL